MGYVQFSGVSSINTPINLLVTNHEFFVLFQRVCKMLVSYFETDFMPLCITFYTDKGVIFFCASNYSSRILPGVVWFLLL